MFKKNIKIYSIVSAVLFLEDTLMFLIAGSGYRAVLSDLLNTFALLLPPVIIAFIFQLISLKFQKKRFYPITIGALHQLIVL